MNQIFRLVWNSSTGCWVAAAETSRAQGKHHGSARRQRRRLGMKLQALAATLALGSGVAWAQNVPVTTVVPSAGKTNVYYAPNGVPVVNIETANSRGLSHNVYSRYDVEAKGLVLNNGNNSQIARQSQLAGQVVSNLNLVDEARVILNEVNSTRRSVLAGFTEVLGSKADVIVANPNGITCNGCGFINSDRVTLTTGRSNVLADGTLGGFTVTGGDLLIEGNGINATEQQVFDLVARSLRFDAPVTVAAGGSLGITAGANTWDYAARAVTGAATPSGEAPAYAIDSTVLGGMYAGRIRIIATEAGAGVRMLGDAAASADDFSITSAGKVQLRAALSAAGEMRVATTSATGDADLQIEGSATSLTAGADLRLDAAAGQVAISESALYAGGDLRLSAAKLLDVSTASPGASRYAEGEASFAVSGETVMRGTAWGAGTRMAAAFDSLNVDEAGFTLFSGGELDLRTRGNMALNGVALNAGTQLILTSTEGAISTRAGSAQGLQGGTSVQLSAATGVDNAGKISADTGELRVRTGGAVSNSGTLHAGANLDIADASGAGAVAFNNAGTALADGRLLLAASTLANTGTLQATSGSSIVLSGALSNASGARLDLGTAASASSTVDAASLVNDGTLQTGGDAAFNVTTALTNRSSIITGGDLTVRGRSAAAYTLGNQSRLQAGGALDIAGQGGSNAVTVALGAGAVAVGATADLNASSVTLASGAQLSSSGDFSLNAGALTLAASDSRLVTATGGGTSTVTLASAFSNPGLVFSGGTLALQAPSVDNTTSGGIAARDTLQVTTTGALRNSGTLYAGEQLTLQVGGMFTNVGTRNAAIGSVDSGGDMTITAGELLNQSTLMAAGDLQIQTPVMRNEVEGGDTREWVRRSNFDRSESSSSEYRFPDKYETTRYTETWTDYQRYAGGTPTFKPQIVGGGTVDISGFDRGVNMAGVISGNTVRLTGNGSAATFVNDDLALTATDVRHTWQVETHYIALGPAKYGTTRSNDNTSSNSYTTYQPSAVGLFANTLEASGFGLTNAGSPFAAAPSGSSTPGAPSLSSQAGALGFGGLSLTLPSSPNGVFVTSKDPNAQYLVESNPLFGLGKDFVGSDYMADRYGYNPDTLVKRLGDANYEAYLIQQQIVQQTGAQLLAGSENDAQQVARLMDQALDEANRQGFTYGKAPTADQLAALTQDIVWMVETVVNGQTVLAPVVYLAPATRNAIASGPTISANTTTLALETLSNTGGTIAGGDNLSITARGDITNTSGNISGGNVALTSTEGSVVNQTLAQGSGGDGNYQTTIGKQAGISATGALSINAAKDITNLGAQMSAGTDANLQAGGNITFDTVENRTSTSTASGSGSGMNTRSETSTTTSVDQVRSGLTVGGNLNAKAGGDITLAGTQADVGGNAALDAGGNLNIVARENTTQTTTTSKESGFGVAGGTFGTTQSESSTFSSRNVGSQLNIGGNADLKAGKTVTLQGSDLGVGGDASITAQDVQVLAGKDVDSSRSSSSSTSLLSGASDGVTLAQTTTTESEQLSQRSVGSTLGAGGKLTINATDTLKLQGSDVSSGGDLEVNARNVELLAAQNIETSRTSTTTTSIGLYAASDNSAQGSAGTSKDAGADASASGPQGGSVGQAGAQASGSAGAEASGSAASNSAVEIARIQTDTSETRSVTNTGSSLRSGGNMTLNVQEKLRAVGSTIEADGDVNLSARDMSFEAAQDTFESRTTSSRTTVGLYAEAGAQGSASAGAQGGADANAQAGLNGASAGAGVSGEAKAEAEGSAKVGVGIQAKNVTNTEESGSSTALVSTIKSGSGSITRTAQGTIRDVGTNIEAAGDLNQSATTIESLAATNSQYSRSSTEETVARIGVYAEASGSASAGASGQAGVSSDGGPSASAEAGAEVNAEAKAGIEMTVDRSVSTETRQATQAVTSNIKVGGNVNSRSSGKTVLQGTNIDAGGDVNLAAQSLDVQAARDTETITSTQESLSTRAAVNVGVTASAGASASASSDEGTSTEAGAEAGARVGVEASAEYNGEKSSTSNTKAVVANISGGGKLNIQTTDATRLEGTNLSGAKGVDINAGSLDFQAARDTSTSNSEKLGVKADLAAYGGLGNANEAAVSASMEGERSSESSTQAVVGSINSGAGLNITTRGDTRLEGTQVNAAGDTQVTAGGNVTLDAARNTFESSKQTVNASAGVDTGEGTVSVAGGYTDEKVRASEAVTGSLTSGGSLNISAGGNARFEGTQVEAGKDAQIAAGGNVTMDAARNTYSAQSSGVQVEAGFGRKNEDDEEAGTTTKTRSASLGVQASTSSENSSDAVVGGVKAGGNLSVVAGGNARFEGTTLAAGEGAQVAAGGNVAFDAATSTREASSVGVGVGLGRESTSTRPTAGGDKESESEATAELSLDVSAERSRNQAGSTISAGAGGVQISAGRDVTMQGTQVATDGSADVSAGGKIEKRAAVSESSAVGFGLDLSASRKETVGGGDDAAEGEADAAKSDDKADDKAAAKDGDKSAAKADAKADDKADAKAAAKPAESDAEGAAAPEAGAEGGAEAGAEGAAAEPEVEKERSAGLRDITLERSTERVATSIDAAGGTRLRSGSAPATSIPGTSMVLRATRGADGSLRSAVPVPANRPAGTEVAATQPDGQPLPSWLKLDPATGVLSGQPPADFAGALNVVVAVPQADGSVRKIGVSFGDGAR